MIALLGLIPLKDWIYTGIIAAILIGGAYWHHATLEDGIHDQQVADARVSAALEKKTAAETADLQARATMAEQAYDHEKTANTQYRDANPIQPVRLCLDTHNSGGVVPKAGTPVAGNAPTSAAAKPVQPMPAGDHSGGAGAAGPDLAGMLDLLAARADQVSSQLREYQSR
jgi:hypothetical protein